MIKRINIQVSLIQVSILILLVLFPLFAQSQTDTTLTIEEVEILGEVQTKGGIVPYFREIFDVKAIKKSYKTYTLSLNSELRHAKNAFQDTSGIHIYIRPSINSPITQ